MPLDLILGSEPPSQIENDVHPLTARIGHEGGQLGFVNFRAEHNVRCTWSLDASIFVAATGIAAVQDCHAYQQQKVIAAPHRPLLFNDGASKEW